MKKFLKWFHIQYLHGVEAKVGIVSYNNKLFYHKTNLILIFKNE